MSSKEITTTEDAALLALEECEKKIYTSFRRGIEATKAIGKELSKIKAQELFKVRGYDSFQRYVVENLGWDIASVHRVINVFETLVRLEDEGLMLPSNESQAAELARLTADRQGPVWKRIVSHSEKDDEPITVAKVRLAVDLEEKRQAEKEASQQPAPKKGVATNLDMGGTDASTEGAVERRNGDAPAASHNEGVIALTERGEAALARIRKICGNEVAEAIERFRVRISERDLIKWADQNDQMVHDLAYYVLERWTVSKAISYAEKMIDGGTDVDTLITMSRARGGSFYATHDDARISVEIVGA